jgi:hypothetical protein
MIETIWQSVSQHLPTISLSGIAGWIALPEWGHPTSTQ